MFEVGQKVVCVNNTGFVWVLEKGSVYTVSGFAAPIYSILCGGKPSAAICLKEVDNPWAPDAVGFDVARFRPLINKPNAESISAGVEAFKQLAVDCPPLVEARS